MTHVCFLDLVEAIDGQWFGFAAAAGNYSAPSAAAGRSSTRVETTPPGTNEEQAPPKEAGQSTLSDTKASSCSCLIRCSSGCCSISRDVTPVTPAGPAAASQSSTQPGTPRLSLDGPCAVFEAGSSSCCSRSTSDADDDSNCSTGSTPSARARSSSATYSAKLLPLLRAAYQKGHSKGYREGRRSRMPSSRTLCRRKTVDSRSDVAALPTPMPHIRTSRSNSSSKSDSSSSSPPESPGTPCAPAERAPSSSSSPAPESPGTPCAPAERAASTTTSPKPAAAPKPPASPPKAAPAPPGIIAAAAAGLKSARCDVPGMEPTPTVKFMWDKVMCVKRGPRAVKAAGSGSSSSGSSSISTAEAAGQILKQLAAGSKYLQKVQHQLIMHRPELDCFDADIRAFKPDSMELCARFLDVVDRFLDSLTDSNAVLKLCEGWPVAKLEALQEATQRHRQMLKQAAEAADYSAAAGDTCVEIFSKCQKGISRLTAMVDKFGLEQQRVSKACKAHGVPFQGDALVVRLKASSMAYAHTFMTATLHEVERLEQQQQQQQAQAPPAAAGGKKLRLGAEAVDCQQRQQQLLSNGVEFVFRVHQFVGGLDEQAAAMFGQLSEVLERVWGAKSEADAAAAAAAAAAS